MSRRLFFLANRQLHRCLRHFAKRHVLRLHRRIARSTIDCARVSVGFFESACLCLLVEKREFRGAVGDPQYALAGITFLTPRVSFVAGGNVNYYFLAAFNAIMNAGAESQFNQLLTTYPSYSVFITGWFTNNRVEALELRELRCRNLRH